MNNGTQKILLTCLAYTSEDTKAEDLTRITTKQWHQVVQLARQNMVAPLLYHKLKPLNLAIPGEIMSELRKEQLMQVKRNILIYQELSGLLNNLHGKNIPLIVLKGAHLAELVYDHIGLRFMCDIDLLARKEDLHQIEKELLTRNGQPVERNRLFTRSNFNFSYILPSHPGRIEVHWALSSPVYPSSFDLEGIWHRARPATLSKAPALVMTPEDLLLYLCQHNAVHVDYPNLRMLADICEVIKRHRNELDWQQIGNRAREWGILRAVYVFLRLTRELMTSGISLKQLDNLRPVEFEENNFSILRDKITAIPQYDLLRHATRAEAQAWEIKGIHKKMRFIGKRIFLSRAEMALIYPPSSRSWRIFLYYPLRITNILLWYGKSYLQVIWHAICYRKTQKHAAIDSINQTRAIRTWLMSN